MHSTVCALCVVQYAQYGYGSLYQPEQLEWTGAGFQKVTLLLTHISSDLLVVHVPQRLCYHNYTTTTRL